MCRFVYLHLSEHCAIENLRKIIQERNVKIKQFKEFIKYFRVFRKIFRVINIFNVAQPASLTVEATEIFSNDENALNEKEQNLG